MFNLSMEMIDYQVNDFFPPALEKIVSKIKKDLEQSILVSNKEVINEYGSDITDLIFKRFGLTMTMDPVLHYYLPAAIIPFTGDNLLSVKGIPDSFINMASKRDKVNGVTLVKHIEKVMKDKEKEARKLHNKKGFVNTKYAKVGGYLSDVRHYLIVNFVDLLKEGISPLGVVAVIVHEIGHAFTGLETHYRSVTTNNSIGDVLSELNKNKPDKAVYQFKRHFGKDELIEAGLNEDSEITDFYGVLAGKYIKSLDSQNYNAKYDENNFENMADSFAARMGLGKEIVEALYILHKKYDYSLHSSATLYYINNFISFLSVVFFFFVFLPPLGGVLLFILFSMAGAGASGADGTYDLPLDRFNRVKNSIVGNLKDTRLPKEYTKSLIDQIDVIEFILDNTYYSKGVIATVIDNLMSKDRNAVYYRVIQQDVENALNNSLFVGSAKLRSL